jgi:hypothetical protein
MAGCRLAVAWEQVVGLEINLLRTCLEILPFSKDIVREITMCHLEINLLNYAYVLISNL